MAPSFMGKCTIYVLSENNISVIIITMNIYSYDMVMIYLIVFKSIFFYYYSYRVQFSKLSILNFLPIFIMENDFLIYSLDSFKLSVILKTKCKRDPVCIIPSMGCCLTNLYSFLMGFFCKFSFIHLFNKY